MIYNFQRYKVIHKKREKCECSAPGIIPLDNFYLRETILNGISFRGVEISPIAWICVSSTKLNPNGNLLKFVKYLHLIYSPFTLTWLMTNDFQVEFFSFNYQKQWKLSVCKKVINKVRVNGLYLPTSKKR